MKLALVTETYPPEVNGVAMTLQRVVHGLARRGHEIEVVRPHQARMDPFDGANLANPRHLLMPAMPLPFYKELKLGLPVGRRLRRRWTEWRPDIVHIATEGPLGWSALRAARKLRIPISTTFHTNFHQYTQRYLFNATRSFALGYLRNFHNRAGCTLVPTNQAADELRAEKFQRVGVLSRGVDGKLFNPSRRTAELRRSWGVDANGADTTPVFAYVGRIAVEKNIELAVEAFLEAQKVLPEARFVLVGDGPARADLATRYPQFHFAGMRRGEDLAAHYASADAFLFPSTTETFGNVVTEGMASGLVVLTFDYAAGRQHVRSWQNGVLATFGDRDAFRRAAVEIAQRRAEWPAIRTAARATAEGVTWDAIFASFEKSLSEVMAGTFADSPAVAARSAPVAEPVVIDDSKFPLLTRERVVGSKITDLYLVESEKDGLNLCDAYFRTDRGCVFRLPWVTPWRETRIPWRARRYKFPADEKMGQQTIADVRLELDADGTPKSSPWIVFADGTAIYESLVYPEGILPGIEWLKPREGMNPSTDGIDAWSVPKRPGA